MSPILQDKLLDLLVNIVSIILGGGLVLLLIEWRRHTRERNLWAREDAMVLIDIPRAEMFITQWQIQEAMDDADKLNIYENQLEDTIKRLVVIVEFVIRNTTAAELIATSYDVNILQLPSAWSTKDFYELDTFDLISKDDIGAIRLKPYETIPRYFLYSGFFGETGKLESPPTTVSVEVTLSNGKVIQGKDTLNAVLKLPSDIGEYQNKLQPNKYIDKIAEPEEIPF